MMMTEVSLLFDAEAVTTRVLVLAVAAVGGADRKRVAEVGVVASERSNRTDDIGCGIWDMGDE